MNERMDQFTSVMQLSGKIATDALHGIGSTAEKLGISKLLYVAGPETKPAPPSSVTSNIGSKLVSVFGDVSPWIRVAGLSGAIAVSMGAYGAHGLKKVPQDQLEVFETGMYMV